MKRSKFTEEQIIRILKEADAGGTVKDLCRRHGCGGPRCSRSSRRPREVDRTSRRDADRSVVSTGPMGEPAIVLQSDCKPDLNQDLVSEAVEKILKADIRDDLNRRAIDLDSKLQSIELVIERTVLLDEYLGQIE